MIITKEQFLAYEKVRKSEKTNMYNSRRVIELADELADVVLTKDMIFEIMMSYKNLAQKYLKKEAVKNK